MLAIKFHPNLLLRWCVCVGVFKDVSCEVKISLTKHEAGFTVPAAVSKQVKMFPAYSCSGGPERQREKEKKKKKELC